MHRLIRLLRSLLLVPLCLAVPLQSAGTAEGCALLTRAEIQAALGQPVGDGKPNAKANPMGGIPCEYKVGSAGVFSVVLKDIRPGETPDRIMAELKKLKIAVAEAPGIGERAFFASPGYGMVQLNAFRGGRYLIITLLVPGLSEAAQKAAATKLMQTALKRV